MPKIKFWLPSGLYESLPLLCLLSAATCLALARAWREPVLLVASVLLVGYAAGVTFARWQHARRRLLRVPESGWCEPSLESRFRSEDYLLSLQSRKARPAANLPKAPDFADTWFTWEK